MTRRRWFLVVAVSWLAAVGAAALDLWLLAVAVATAPAYIAMGWLARDQRESADLTAERRETRRLRARVAALEDEVATGWDRHAGERWGDADRSWPTNGTGYHSPRFSEPAASRPDAAGDTPTTTPALEARP